MNKQSFELQLNKYDTAYHRGEPLITDEEYDALVDNYQTMYGKYTRQRIITECPLPIPGPSLDKIKSEEDVIDFLNKYPGDMIVMDKIDGISLFVTYTATSTTVLTHTDEYCGTNITHLLPHLKVPQSLNLDIGDKVVVRGELCIKIEVFEKIKGTKYNSPRNIIPIVNKKNASPDIVKHFDFLAFQLMYQTSNGNFNKLTPLEQLQELKKLGFETVKYKVVKKLKYIDLLKQLEEDFEYARDGVVLAQNQFEETTHNLPKNKIAFKIVGKQELTTVTSVEWNESKNAYLKPTVLYESVNIDYGNLGRASGFHAKFIKDNKIGPGTKILVTRRGGVIPYIEKVIEGTTAMMPEDDYEWDTTETNIYIKMNDKVRIKQIHSFFEVLGVKFLGPSTVGKLYEAGFKDINSIITATIEDLLKVAGIKAAGAKRIVEEIEKGVNGITLSKIMVGSCLFPGFGSTKIDSIVAAFSMEDILHCNLTVIDIQKIDGIMNSADVFIDNLKTFTEFLDAVPIIKNKLTVPLDIELPLIDEPTSSILQGQTIVFSGDKKLTDTAKRMGAIVDKGITKRTTMLVVSNMGEMNNKEKTCIAKGIKVMSLKEFKTTYQL